MQLLGALKEYLKVRKIPSDYFASTLRDVGLVGRITVNAIVLLVPPTAYRILWEVLREK